MAQSVEHILGKDEVPGSNPGISSESGEHDGFSSCSFVITFLDCYSVHIECKADNNSLRGTRCVRRDIYSLITPEVGFITAVQLPNDPVLNETAVVTVSDTSVADVMVTIPEDDYVRIDAKKFGTTELTVTCGGNEYRYSLTIEKVDENTNDVRIESIS